MNIKENLTPLVFIGVPVYNGGAYLVECLESILTQTYSNWECAIIDNKSTDNTNKIAREFVNKDDRFKLYENIDFVDQTTNWNISFSKMPSNAKYFKIVCADDWLYPQFLSFMVPLLEQRPDTGFCSSYRLDGTKVRCVGLDIYEGNFFLGEKILIEQLQRKLDITGSVNTLLYRTETLKKLDYYPEIFRPNTYHIDTILAFDVLAISNLAFVFQVLSYTRRHNETYTNLISNRFKTPLYLYEMSLKKFKHLDPKLEKEYSKIRINYARFLFTKKLKRDKSCLEWHEKHSNHGLGISDYFKALIYRNSIKKN